MVWNVNTGAVIAALEDPWGSAFGATGARRPEGAPNGRPPVVGLQWATAAPSVLAVLLAPCIILLWDYRSEYPGPAYCLGMGRSAAGDRVQAPSACTCWLVGAAAPRCVGHCSHGACGQACLFPDCEVAFPSPSPPLQLAAPFGRKILAADLEQRPSPACRFVFLARAVPSPRSQRYSFNHAPCAAMPLNPASVPAYAERLAAKHALPAA